MSENSSTRMHTIRRLGNFDRDFRLLDPTEIKPENGKSVTGLDFYYMQSAKEFLAVGVAALRLRPRDNGRTT